MTTIATDGRSMAGDSLVTASRELVGHMVKVRKVKGGKIIGTAGVMTDCIRFTRWMEAGCKGERPALTDDFCALALNPDGTVDYYGQELEPCRYITPMTIGSGGDFALGAMLAGKTPAEAVALAMTRDTATGGKITEISL